MKGFIWAIVIVSCSLQVTAKTKNDVANDKLKGKVKSVAITGYRLKMVAGKPQKDKTLFTSYSKYNENGSILQFVTSGLEDSLEGEAVKFKAVKSMYTYDADGNLLGKNDYKPDGTLQDSSFFKVDNKGSRVDYYTYRGDGTIKLHTQSDYNIHSDLIELIEYVDGKFKSRTTYTYDDTWNETDETGYYENGSIKWKEVFKYNQDGALSEVTDFKDDDSFDGRFTYRYDTRGNLAEETEYFGDTSTRNKKTTTKYDLKGEPVEINHFNYRERLVNQVKVEDFGLHFTDINYNDDATLKSIVSRKYDDKANLVQEDRFYTKDSVKVRYDYKFEYDKEGNWTKNTTTKNGKPVQVTERKIEYYTDQKDKKKK